MVQEHIRGSYLLRFLHLFAPLAVVPMATMSFRDGSFHDHLRALTAEYERLLHENKAQRVPNRESNE